MPFDHRASNLLPSANFFGDPPPIPGRSSLPAGWSASGVVLRRSRGPSACPTSIFPRPLRFRPDGSFTCRSLPDLMAEQDHRVGQIVGCVEQAGISDNTLIVFSSDNAALGQGEANVWGGSNRPFRGSFYQPPWEGCHRTDTRVRWPGKVPAGVVTNEMLSSHDWYKTFAGHAGLVPGAGFGGGWLVRCARFNRRAGWPSRCGEGHEEFMLQRNKIPGALTNRPTSPCASWPG
jgi:hypothetical protein